MHILNPYEDYTKRKMVNILPVLSSLGFKRVAGHISFCSTHHELKNDTAYFYCRFDGMRRDLRRGTRIVQIAHPPLPQQRDYSRLHPRISQDITFMDDTYTIGWYNTSRNVLWLSDVFHQKDEGEPVLGEILSTIIRLRPI